MGKNLLKFDHVIVKIITLIVFVKYKNKPMIIYFRLNEQKYSEYFNKISEFKSILYDLNGNIKNKFRD